LEKSYGGPARVSGSAGTGNTIVALHRAVHLARRNPDARVLLTTFSETLAGASEPRLGKRIDVRAIDVIGLSLFKAHFGPGTLASRADVQALLTAASAAVDGHKFGAHFLLTE
jgi:superfamily I DNA/RNA helicase